MVIKAKEIIQRVTSLLAEISIPMLEEMSNSADIFP